MGIKDLAVSYVLFSALHLCCFALALTTCGLYGTDLHRANQQHKYSDSKWVSELRLAAGCTPRRKSLTRVGLRRGRR